MLCQYERTIFQAQTGFCIFAYQTKDTSVPEAARNKWCADDGYQHFTAVGYNLPATDTIKVEMTGKWTTSK